MKQRLIAVALFALIVTFIGCTVIWNSIRTGTTVGPSFIQTVYYVCAGNKWIMVSYYDGPARPRLGAGMPPTPGGSVAIQLSDGRAMTLPQTLSASGIRYANTDESVVFWSKGNGATLAEGQPDYFCIKVASDPGGLKNFYLAPQQAFSIRYPEHYSVNAKYKYQALGPDKTIYGTKFTIDPSLTRGTNLSSDSYISVEQIPAKQNCNADLFLQGGKASDINDQGATYSYKTYTDAGAGNRYEEHVYAIPGTNPCFAVRYFIHYSVLQNYPAGTVKQFDEHYLLDQFDSIRRTLVLD